MWLGLGQTPLREHAVLVLSRRSGGAAVIINSRLLLRLKITWLALAVRYGVVQK
jgi:hypothetical protein